MVKFHRKITTKNNDGKLSRISDSRDGENSGSYKGTVKRRHAGSR